MNADTSVSLAVAVLCVLAVGISATTLESSLSTDPDDVIDIEWDQLPISQDDAAAIEREIQGRQDPEQQSSSGGDEQEAQSQTSDAASSDQQSSGEGEEQQQQASQQEERPSDPQTREPNFWDKLLALLRDLLPWLVALGVFAAGCALAYRYRERLLALAALVMDRHLGGEAGEGDGTGWFRIDPATEIDRLWLRVVRYLDLEDPETTTVTEASHRAIETGLDPDGVRELADVFEEVRYGDRPASEERRRRALESYRQLGLDERDRSDGTAPGGRSDRSSGGDSL